jgi:CheY-like chemotaxis protein
MPEPPARKLVLCVDDQPEYIGFMEPLLKSRGFEYRLVETCAEALSFVQRYRVTVSILDVLMPDADGFELCEKILSLSPETKVILFSVDTRPGAKERAVEVGAKAFFGKPTNLDEMIAVINELAGQAA